jgi:hypothetical protein
MEGKTLHARAPGVHTMFGALIHTATCVNVVVCIEKRRLVGTTHRLEVLFVHS